MGRLNQEGEDTGVDWCEARLVTQTAVALLMKGVAFRHPSAQNPVPNFVLWDRWVYCSSPNAQTVCKSRVPVLTYKAFVLARDDLNRQINLASLVRGFNYKGYPKSWWWPQVRSALTALSQLHLVPNYLVKKWAREGRGFRMSLGPASVAHFAPALPSS